jgi:hypothetical protein
MTDPEAFMKFVRKQAVLLVVLSAFICSIVPTCPGAGPAALPAGNNPAAAAQNTAPAEKELERLGVPLQKDPAGTVRWIEAKKGELSDEALGYLPSLPGLEWLEIGGGAITPAGMKHLGKCTALKRLYIHDIDLQEDEMTWLSTLKRLEALSLQRTKISGKVLKNLDDATPLIVLNLSGDNIVDADMDQVARFKTLEVLALADTPFTSAGLEKLAGMSRLNELNITNCVVQDYDLQYFLSMPNLRIVYAEGCKMSDLAVMGVIARFPTLAIFR